jgi:hypothetical protein
MVCLQASEKQMSDAIEQLGNQGECRYKYFIDSDLPQFGWTAIAFDPMTRENGRELFGHLRLA